MAELHKSSAAGGSPSAAGCSTTAGWGSGIGGSAVEASSGSRGPPGVNGSRSGLVQRGELEQKFEEEFSQHLQKKNRLTSFKLGAVGAGIGGVIGVAASPVLLPGLAVAALVGGAGGYQWAKRWGRQELQRHGAVGSEIGEGSEAAPTLRRLRYLVKWGHWQLLEYEAAPVESRCTVLDEVTRAFSPWVQKMYLLRARGVASESDVEAREAFQHLAPLYYLLQRRAATEAMVESAGAVGCAFDAGSVDPLCAERCRVIFPTVLETISMLDRLSPATHAQLLKETSATSQFGPDYRANRRNRLKRIVDAIRGVIERTDVQQALSDPRRFEHRVDHPEAGGEGQDGAPAAEPPSPASSSSSTMQRSLVLPPEGVEDEPGGAPDDGEYYSLSEGSEDEHGKGNVKKGARPLSPLKGAAQSGGQVARFHKRLEALPFDSGGDVDHTWRPFDASMIDVRSATYLRDRRKMPSEAAMLELVNVDFQLVGDAGPVWRVAEHTDFFPHHHRQSGDRRFLFIQNWVFPPYQCVITGALDPKAPWLSNTDSPQARVWRKFLEADEAQRRELLKVIFWVEKGPWLVKRVSPKKPVLVGKKVKMSSFHKPDEYIEVVVDVVSGRAEAIGTGVVCSALKRLEMAYSVLIEAREEAELPENILLCASCLNVDPAKFFVAEV